MKIIKKKIWPEMFDNDRKLNIDFRLADFSLKKGDKIIYREWDPKIKRYTGREYSKNVKHVTRHNNPQKYWDKKDLDKFGLYIIEFK